MRLHHQIFRFVRFLTLLVGSLGGIAYLTLFLFQIFSAPPLKQESRSPAALGSIVLLEEALPLCPKTAIWLFAWDRSVSGGPIDLDSFSSDGRDDWKYGVWSRDGSVFATVVVLGTREEKDFKKDFAGSYASAYDFHTHRRLSYQTQSVSTRVRSQQIAALMQQRGGKDIRVFPRPYMKLGRELMPWERGSYGDLYAWDRW